MLATRSFPPIHKFQASGMTIGFPTYAFSIYPLKGRRSAFHAAHLLCGAAATALRARDVVDMDMVTEGCAQGHWPRRHRRRTRARQVREFGSGSAAGEAARRRDRSFRVARVRREQPPRYPQ
jgi:hypothetical protein